MTVFRVLSLNICLECGQRNEHGARYWADILYKTGSNVICLQETVDADDYCMTINICKYLNMKIINGINKYRVLYNDNKKGVSIITNLQINKTNGTIIIDGVDIKIQNLHLTDVPELDPYKCTDIDNINAYKARIPFVKEAIENGKNYQYSIITGDFNETSHLDTPIKCKNVSLLLENNGYIDSWIKNKSIKYTWNHDPYYKSGIKQRIDMIYYKGLKIHNFITYSEKNNWFSDHYAVIADFSIY